MRDRRNHAGYRQSRKWPEPFSESERRCVEGLGNGLGLVLTAISAWGFFLALQRDSPLYPYRGLLTELSIAGIVLGLAIMLRHPLGGIIGLMSKKRRRR